MKDILQSIYSNLLKIGRFGREPVQPRFPKIGFLKGGEKDRLEKVLGIRISNTAIFEQALIHRSYVQIANLDHIYSNERLEFLGDAALGMIVGEYLFFNYADIAEGDLTKMRSRLVNRTSLAWCARTLQLETFLMVSMSAGQSLASGNDSILSDALESIIAAIYLDSGIDAARTFVIGTLLPRLLNEGVMKDTNYKSILLETVQSIGSPVPIYTILRETGPDHNKSFYVGVSVGDKHLGNGSGKSKKQAEQNAACEALQKHFPDKLAGIGPLDQPSPAVSKEGTTKETSAREGSSKEGSSKGGTATENTSKESADKRVSVEEPKRSLLARVRGDSKSNSKEAAGVLENQKSADTDTRARRG